MKKSGRGKSGRGSGKKLYIENEEELAIRNAHFDSIKSKKAEESDEEIVSEEQFEKERERIAAANVAKISGKISSMSLQSSEASEGVVTSPKTIADESLDKEFGAPRSSDGLNRKQREELEAIRKKEEYQRRHLAGETEQAKRELAQLAIVRARREAAAKKREAEGRAPGMSSTGLPSDSEASGDESSDDDTPSPSLTTAQLASKELAAKKKAAALGTSESEEPSSSSSPAELPRLKGPEVKAMNGDQLKDALKARGLSYQGTKKDLIKRLTDYEAARA